MFTRHIQPSFSGGEVSPSLAARVDSTAYATWLQEACNVVVHPQGGVSNRPGTAYMGTAKYTDKPCRIIPFVVGEEESYVLEFGHQYIRVYTSAGQMLDDDSDPYEISSPYAADDLASLSFAQYDQKLFLAHPNYPLYGLSRVAQGRFTLAQQPVQFGPFQLANTQENHKLRITTSQESQEVTGVAATLSFAPVVDNRYFVYGYFQNELFYVAEDYGLNITALVNAFNTRYNASGLTASNLGGVIKITSPVATGGNWNGAVLRLTYRDSFAHEPAIVIEQALSGGVNDGGTVIIGDTTYLLESNFDLFTPLHVGARFSVTHALESQYQTGTLGYEDISSVIKSSCDWRVQTSGTWTGTIVLEKSEDLGATWQAVKYFIRTSADDNTVAFGTLEDTGTIYQLRLRACQITGQAGYELSAEAFKQEGVAVVEEYISPQQVKVNLERPCGALDWTSDWAEGSFSPKNGYASCVFFYQDRLGLAGTYAEPQTLWFSKTGAYSDFGHARGALLDSDSISINLSGKKLNAIHQVAAAGRLLVFTAGSEWTLSAPGALTPYNIQIEQQSERGSSRTSVVMVGNRALYVQARGASLRDFYYNYTSASYTGEDLTLCAKHLFQNKEIKEVAYQQEPDNLIWCVLSDGGVASLTYVAEHNVCAWSHHNTQGQYRSVCTIPNRGYDEVWFVVQRANGYCIEKLLPRLASKEPQDQVFLDASVSKKSDTAFMQVTGLSHLEGKTVGVLAEGSPLTGLEVSNGAITLPRAMKCVHVGLTYQSKIQTLPLVSYLENGQGPDTKKRVVSVTLQLVDSRGGTVSLKDETGEEIIQRMTEPYNTPLSLKTASYMLPLSGTHTLTPSVIFTQADPLPVTLLALLCRMA